MKDHNMSTKDYNLYRKLKTLSIESLVKAEERGIPIETVANGEADAFRHVYSRAKVTIEDGDASARILGTVNEVIHRNSDAERYMDEYNNTIGRELGRRAIEEGWDDERLSDEVKKAIDKGYVIINTGSVSDENMKENPYYIPESNPNLQFPNDNKNKNEPSKDAKQNRSSGPSNANGPVFVHPYARRNGEVKDHTRSRPDENIGNNFSAQKSKPSTEQRASPFRQPSEDEERLPGVLYYKN